MPILHFTWPSVFLLYLIVRRKGQGHVGHQAPRAWVSSWLWCHSVEREGGGTWEEKSGDGEFPTVIYLFTNRATLCKPQECLAPWPIISFKLLQALAVHLLPYWGWLDKGWENLATPIELSWTTLDWNLISHREAHRILLPLVDFKRQLSPKESEVILSEWRGNKWDIRCLVCMRMEVCLVCLWREVQRPEGMSSASIWHLWCCFMSNRCTNSS